MRNFIVLLAMASLTAVFAQGTTPEQKGKPLSMAQLTPGNKDNIYAKNLLNVHFDENGVLQYTKPEDAKNDGPMPRGGFGRHNGGEWRAINEGNKLFVEKGEGDNKIRQEVSDDSKGDIVWGQSVHRNEFGINGGIFWSPDKSLLAFYRMDETMVQSYPLVQSDDREATVKWVKYPMAGMTSHQVTLGVYNPETKTTVYMKTLDAAKGAEEEANGLCDPEHYLTCISWRPDGKQIFIAELNRLQNYLALNAYDAATGDFVQTLFIETSEKYVEPQNPLYFLPNSNNKFIWQSQRDGYNHMYLYEIKNEQAAQWTVTNTQLTSGPWLVSEIIGADPKVKSIYIMATKDSPLESNLYQVDIKSKKIVRMTKETGVHRVMMSKDYTQFYDTYTNHETPRVSQLCKIKGNKVTSEVLYTAPNPFEGYARPEVTVGTLKAADGQTDLYYRLVKPENFDASKKYPVVVYLYNGPHAQLVTEGYQFGLPGWDCYMAQNGFVVFTVDGRGSSNRGLEFEQTIWHNLGENEGKDQMQGIAFLKTLPYVDADRIGIYGWSYGGFMATYMKLNYPETFKVGVCGGPVLDWSRYEVMYGERYMGTPQNNPDGYARNRMIDQAGKLKGKLLIIHDDQDATVVPQMSFQFLKKSVETGTYPDFMIYPNHEHNVRGKDRVHLQTRIAKYFIDNL